MKAIFTQVIALAFFVLLLVFALLAFWPLVVPLGILVAVGLMGKKRASRSPKP